MESRGEEWGSQVGKGPSVPASPPRTPHPHGGKHPGFPAPKTAVTVCVEGAAAGTREQVLRHCCSPGLRAKWTQNSRAGYQAQPLTWTLPPSPRLKPESQGPPARLGLTAGTARSVGSSSREQSGRRSTPVTLGWGHRHTQHPSQLLCLREQLLLHCSASLCQLELVVKKIQTGKNFQAAPVLPLRLQSVNTAKGLSWHYVRMLLPKNL